MPQGALEVDGDENIDVVDEDGAVMVGSPHGYEMARYGSPSAKLSDTRSVHLMRAR